MNKNNYKIKQTLALGIATIGLTGLILNPLNTQAAFNASASRYEDSLTATKKEAVYNYNYENTSADEAPGYFELTFEKLIGADPKDLIEVKSIVETTPIDFETKKVADDAKTVEFKVSDAVYTDKGQLKVRISPQSECKVRPEGGCADGMIPAAKPSRITVTVAMKDSAPKESSMIFGTGRIFFPNGYDINALGWKINVNEADESKVTVPEIKDEIVDQQAIIDNSALKTQSTTENTVSNPVSDQKTEPKVESTALNSNTQQANTQELSAKNTENKTNSTESPSNVAIISVLGGLGAVVVAAVTFFMLKSSKKSHK